MKKKRVKSDKDYWIANDNENLKRLEAHKNEPYEVLTQMFGGRTRKTLVGVMYENKIRRDRDQAPNATKNLKKWTPERIEELREDRNKSWPELQAKYRASQNRLEKVMSANGIRRDRPEETLWSDEADRVLIQAALESHQHNRYTAIGRMELRRIYAETAAKLKEAGFGGSTAKNALSLHLKDLSQARLETLGFTGRQTPLGWSMPAEPKSPQATKSTKKTTPTTKDWHLHLSSERKTEFEAKFLADYRSDCREANCANVDLLLRWPEAINDEGLRYAARSLGETRNRIQIAYEYKTAAQVEKAIEARMTELILEGILIDATGNDGFFERIRGEFSKDLELTGLDLTKEYFLKKIDKLLWTEGKNGTLTTLKDFVERRLPIENFQRYHRHVPQEMAKAKATELSGLTSILSPPPFASSFVSGIGRLSGDEDITKEMLEAFRLPETDFSQPFEIPLADPLNFKIGVISGPHVGILHTRLIEENTMRCALAYAERKKYEHLVLTGIFDIDMTKAGPVRGIKALYSGRSTKIDVLDPSYQEEARRIIDEIKANEFTSEIVYEAAREALKNLLTGLWKIALRPEDEKRKTAGKVLPEFSGKVWVVLGPKEFDLIIAAAHAEVLYLTLLKQAELRTESSAAAGAAKRAEKLIKKFGGWLARLEQSLAQTQDPQERADLEAKCISLRQTVEEHQTELASLRQKFIELKRQEARTRITNVRPEDWRRFTKMALALVALLIERAIPNSKVIALGKTYLKVGPEPKDKIKIVIPGHLRVTDALISDYASQYGPEALSMEMPETVIICHPHAISYALTAREVDSGGKRDYAPRIYVAPICVDGAFLRKKTEEIIRKSHPIAQVVSHPQFQGGILEVSSVNGIISASPVTVETLSNYGRKEKPPKKQNAVAGKYIWVMVATDQHWGGRAKEFLFDRELGKSLGMAEASFHLMRKAGYGDGEKLPPFHMFVVNDDPTQGHHFPAEKEPHRHEMPFHLFEQELEKLRRQLQNEKKIGARNKIIEKIRSLSLRQVRVRGTDSFTRQMEAFIDCHIAENVDMFSGMLSRSAKAGLILHPVSEFEDFLEVPFDTCDLGLINLGTGNHGLRTTEDNLAEGLIYAKVMKPYLLTRPKWAGKNTELDRLVKGPIFGNKFIAFGTMQAPGGYEWGFDLRNTPAANSVDWGNTVRMGARTDLRRANYARIFEKKMVIKIFGDKHFLGALLTWWALYFMAPAGTHTDGYGERGFPPNNSGIAFLGLPAEGPTAGPILIRPLLIHHLRDFIETNPRPFDWEAFLPDAL